MDEYSSLLLENCNLGIMPRNTARVPCASSGASNGKFHVRRFTDHLRVFQKMREMETLAETRPTSEALIHLQVSVLHGADCTSHMFTGSLPRRVTTAARCAAGLVLLTY